MCLEIHEQTMEGREEELEKNIEVSQAAIPDQNNSMRNLAKSKSGQEI